MNNPFISTIIIAHFNRNFLIEAMKSAVSQTLSRKEYEVLLVRDFQDEFVTKLANELGIVDIFVEELSIGPKIVRGIKEARGEILCFLEDDDLFIENKMSDVFKKFKNSTQLTFYHNSDIVISEFGKIIGNGLHKKIEKNIQLNVGEISIEVLHKLIKLNVAGNPSCMCIRKELLIKNLHSLGKIQRAPDTFLFISALNIPGEILLGNIPLTKLRIHGKNTSMSRGSLLEAVSKREDFMVKARDDRRIIKDIITKPTIKNFFDQINLRNELEYFIRLKRKDIRIFMNSVISYLKTTISNKQPISPIIMVTIPIYLFNAKLGKKIFGIFEWFRENKAERRLFKD